MDLLLQIGLGNAVLATLLALLAAGLGRILRRPALTHGLWLLVLLKLITPSLWPVQVWPNEPEPHTAVVEAVPGSSAAEPALEAGEPPAASEESGALVVATEGAAPPSPPDQAPVTAAPPASGVSWRLVIAGVWLAGTAWWLLVCAGRVYQLRRLLRHARPASAELREEVRWLAERMGLRRCPAVWMVPGVVSPMLWASGGKPRLLIPTALWARISAAQRITVLAHELAHLCRGDHWVRGLELVATSLFWWHPVLWWARRELGIAEEECCDAWVVGTLPAAARDYALALVETVDFLSEVRPALPPAASGVGQVPLLRRRLAMIMLGTTPKRLSGGGLLALLGLGAVALPVLPTWAQEPRSKEVKVQVVAPDGTTPGDERRVIVVSPGDEAGKKAMERVQLIRQDERKIAGSVEDARDEVELLAIQLEVKKAEVAESEVRIKQAQRDLERVGKLKASSAGSQGEYDAARDKLEIAQAQLQQKHAQLKEAAVRLEQAKRRLARMQQGKEPPRSPSPTRGPAAKEPARATWQVVPREGASQEEIRRLQEMEQKLRATLEQLHQTEAVQQKLLAEREAARAAAEQARAAAEKAAKAQRDKAELGLELKKAAGAKGAKEDKEVARLKALEDRLDALTREMEALRKDLRELLPRNSPPRRPGQPVEPPRSEAVPRDNRFFVVPKEGNPSVPYKLVPAPTPAPERDPRSTPTVPLKPATDQVPR